MLLPFVVFSGNLREEIICAKKWWTIILKQKKSLKSRWVSGRKNKSIAVGEKIGSVQEKKM